MAATLGSVTFELVLRGAGQEMVVGTIDIPLTFTASQPVRPDRPKPNPIMAYLPRSCGCPDNSEGCQRNPITGEAGHTYGDGRPMRVSD